MPKESTDHDIMMHAALEQASLAMHQGEVPVGAIISENHQIITRAFNKTEQLQDPCAHAEILAIRQAAQIKNNWRLDDAILYVTLEPCTMCAGAIRAARIKTVIYGATDSKLGACGSLYDVLEDARLGSAPRVIKGVLEDKCQNILSEFFKRLRRD